MTIFGDLRLKFGDVFDEVRKEGSKSELDLKQISPLLTNNSLTHMYNKVHSLVFYTNKCYLN